MQLSLLDFIRSLGSSYTATNQPETKSVGSQKRDLSRKRRIWISGRVVSGLGAFTLYPREQARIAP